MVQLPIGIGGLVCVSDRKPLVCGDDDGPSRFILDMPIQRMATCLRRSVYREICDVLGGNVRLRNEGTLSPEHCCLFPGAHNLASGASVCLGILWSGWNTCGAVCFNVPSCVVSML
jgi:hypothetical protein